MHYAGPSMLMGLAGNDALRQQLRALSIGETDYEGPTGFASGMAAKATEKGIPAVSLWGASPSYLANMANPKLSAALLAASEQLLSQELWREELEAAGREMEKNLDEAVQARPDLAKLFMQLTGHNPEPHVEQPAEPFEFPTAEEVLKELEEHLRKMRGESSDDPPAGS